MTNTIESDPPAVQAAAALAPSGSHHPEEPLPPASVERGQLLKTDRAGRVQVPPERREAILDEFERSGMTGKAFAEHHGIKYPTFASWRSKRKRERAAREDNQVGGEEQGGGSFTFLEVTASEPDGREDRPQSGGGLSVELPGGARMLVRGRDDLALAAELLRCLA